MRTRHRESGQKQDVCFFCDDCSKERGVARQTAQLRRGVQGRGPARGLGHAPPTHGPRRALRPGQPVHSHSLPGLTGASRRAAKHEPSRSGPTGQLLRQRPTGHDLGRIVLEPLQTKILDGGSFPALAEAGLKNQPPHRLLQRQAAAFRPRLPRPQPLRNPPPNHVPTLSGVTRPPQSNG